MAREKIITTLDIGTETIKLLVCQKSPQEKNIKVLGQFEKKSEGVRRGVVIDPEKVSKKIKEIKEVAQRFLSKKISSLFVNIGGSHLTCFHSHGVVAVSRADGKISQEDVERVIDSAQNTKLPPNREILDYFPQEFIIDGEKGIKDPIGLKGIKLEVKTLLLLAFSPYLKNLTEAVLNVPLEIEDILPTPLASSEAVLTDQDKELGVAVLDMGAGTTSLAVFEEGNLIHTAVFPVGSSNITNDIAIGLRCSISLAEKIKKEYGSFFFSLKKKKKEKDKIKVTNHKEEVVFSQKEISKIIEMRVCEIFEEVSKELKRVCKQTLLPAGVVLTGGGIKLPKIVDLAKRELKLPCRIGKPKGFSNLKEELSFSVCCGLAKYAFQEEIKEGKESFEKIKEKIKKFFRIFIP